MSETQIQKARMETRTRTIDDIRREAMASLKSLETIDQANAWNAAYIGPKGAVKAFQRGLGSLPAEDRPEAGRAANALANELSAAFAPVRDRLAAEALESSLARETVDVTLPGRRPVVGTLHPVTRMIDELIEVFAHLGFRAVFGPEVETGRYNFDLLNIPSNHPARDVWDTILIDDPEEGIVLRTHTSPMQARSMELVRPPIRVIAPGKSFRFEAQDASHEWQFTQIEGLAVDRRITMADLKGVLTELAGQLFGPGRKVRFRCDFFPFVEPGVDFSVDCAVCGGKGCRVCKHTGWLEMGGAGMVHPNVLSGVGYDPEEYSGFAFGLGIERLIMMKYGVDDIRAFAGNDIRFLRRFATASTLGN